MCEYGFEENQDFIPILKESTGGRPSVNHALKIDMAKEISMLQRNEKGKEARQYFIKCEKQLKSINPFDGISAELQAILMQDKKLKAIADGVTLVESRVEKLENTMTIRACEEVIKVYLILTRTITID